MVYIFTIFIFFSFVCASVNNLLLESVLFFLFYFCHFNYVNYLICSCVNRVLASVKFIAVVIVIAIKAAAAATAVAAIRRKFCDDCYDYDGNVAKSVRGRQWHTVSILTMATATVFCIHTNQMLNVIHP